MSSIKFLSVVVSSDGISQDPAKVEAVQKMEPPVDVISVRRFMRMVTLVTRFLPHLSNTLAPIRELLCKQKAWLWGPPQQVAFERVKTMLSSETCMACYIPSRPTVVSMDASSFELGVVLMQDQPRSERRAAAFASRSITKTEQKYSQMEKEALAVMWAM